MKKRITSKNDFFRGGFPLFGLRSRSYFELLIAPVPLTLFYPYLPNKFGPQSGEMAQNEMKKVLEEKPRISKRGERMLRNEMLTMSKLLKKAAGEDPEAVEGGEVQKGALPTLDTNLVLVKDQVMQEIRDLQKELLESKKMVESKEKALKELMDLLDKMC